MTKQSFLIATSQVKMFLNICCIVFDVGIQIEFCIMHIVPPQSFAKIMCMDSLFMQHEYRIHFELAFLACAEHEDDAVHNSRTARHRHLLYDICETEIATRADRYEQKGYPTQYNRG